MIATALCAYQGAKTFAHSSIQLEPRSPNTRMPSPTRLRFRPNINPNGPDIIEHGDQAKISERMDMLRNQGGSLPVYKRVSDARWEYLGRYRVQDVTDDAEATAER